MGRKNVRSKASLMDGGMSDSGPKTKKRRSSVAVNTQNGHSNQTVMSSSPRPVNNQDVFITGDLAPPPPSSVFGETLFASNPFDDTPRTMSRPPSQDPYKSPLTPLQMPQGAMKPGPPHTPPMIPQGNMRMPMNQRRPSSVGHQQPMPPVGGPMNPGPPMQSMMGGGKIYPVNTPVVHNSQNKNSPPIYPCGHCRKEIQDNDQSILCESGCNFWYHRTCAGLTEHAFFLLKSEIYCEYACNNCCNEKSIPLVKFKP